MKTPKGKFVFFTSLLCFTFTGLILFALFKHYGYAPFGDNSLATMDANIQYLDFFAYFKDVLEGKNNISYTFSKGLGGTNVAVFSYYLSSPFNLLVVFFDKSDLVTFFNLLVIIKLSLAAATMNIFITCRFEDRENSNPLICILLSISYALCQYSISQSSNIMWFDGFYMLPIILLGVYFIVQKNNPILLSVSVGLSILFNWYTGGINCFFSIMWLFIELGLGILANKDLFTVRYSIVSIFRYGISMILGVALSACLFFPTIVAMQKSEKGALDLKALFNLSFAGNVFSSVEAYSLGAISSFDTAKVSLYCGGLVIIGIICFFAAREISRREKCFMGLVLATMLMLFYWRPFIHVFSLLRNVGSYWYRYSYVGVFFLIFLAAHFYLKYLDKTNYFLTVKSSLIFAVALLFSNYAIGNENTDYVYHTAFLAIIIGFITTFWRKPTQLPKWRATLGLILASAVLLDCSIETKLQMQNYHATNASEFENYAIAADAQVNKVHSIDTGTYRIAQTSTRHTGEHNRAANYNEAMAYNYMAINSYTSSPDSNVRDLLDRLGYRTNSFAMNITNTSIISADSLLGVKYVLSPYEINGYINVDDTNYNGRYIYENPYALPLALTYKSTAVTENTANPFEYQNSLYSQLLGENVTIYTAVEYECTKKGENSVSYSIKAPEGQYALYGNLPWENQFNGVVTINDDYDTLYACWLSPSVFYIPSDTDIQIDVKAENRCAISFGNEQFYALDLDKLSEITQILRQRAVESIELRNGKIHIETRADAGDSMYLAVPYDEWWDITVNGVKVTPEKFADSLYSIKLSQGDNKVIMNYNIPYKNFSIFVSVISAIIILVLAVIIKRRQHRNLSI